MEKSKCCDAPIITQSSDIPTGQYETYQRRCSKCNQPCEVIETGKTEEKFTMAEFDSPKNWTEDYEHENGNYLCKCTTCKSGFFGHKRRVICKECHQPEEQQSENESEITDYLEYVFGANDVSPEQRDAMHRWRDNHALSKVRERENAIAVRLTHKKAILRKKLDEITGPHDLEEDRIEQRHIINEMHGLSEAIKLITEDHE